MSDGSKWPARRFDLNKEDIDLVIDRLLTSKRDAVEDVDGVVADILADVERRGDDAVIEFTRKFDQIELTPDALRIPAEHIERAADQCAPDDLAALNQAAARIEAYHQRQFPEDARFTDQAGVELGHRWTAIKSVGVYVPGGTASYPSSVLMNVIPAKIAGVDRIVMVVPTPGGQINPLVLAAAKRAGANEVYRIGGAQAIGALAFGTATIPPVDKIVGPGNAYVMAAKKQVFGKVGIDLIAGPSEIVVVADGNNDASWIAADLLSQAEHDVSSQSILITDDSRMAQDVETAVEAHLHTLDRAHIAGQSWTDFGAIVLVPNLDKAALLVDAIAPEHLEIALNDPDAFAEKVRNAGAIFLGRYTPEAIGDYVAGTNHVLPTARSARFASGLGVLDFMKRTSIVRCDADSLAMIGGAAVTLAEAEGFGAHALSISIRLNR